MDEAQALEPWDNGMETIMKSNDHRQRDTLVPGLSPLCRFSVLLVIVVYLVVCLGQAKPVAAQGMDDDRLRESVKSAIKRGQQFLLLQQNGDGSFESGFLDGNPLGSNCLIGLSLITSGMDPKSPQIQGCLRYVRSLPETTETYDLGLAILFMSAVGESRDHKRIQRMASTLLEYQTASGGWGYGRETRPLEAPPPRWDNSTSQFAVLGLREAAFQVGMEIDQPTWKKAREHWLKTQVGSPNAHDGAGWGYDNDTGGVRGSMTVAGLASLEITNSFIVEDQLTRDGQLDCCGGNRGTGVDESIDAGIRWMNQHIQIHSNPGGGHLLYYLYGLERAGKFTGQRFFGGRDWYREGAEFLVAAQVADGSWAAQDEGPVIGSSLTLLFLSKGLSPVLINKLQFGPRDRRTGEIIRPDWNRHRHDVANLVDYISLRDEWPHYMSWQTLDLQVAAKGEGVSALQQAPIAYLSSDTGLETIVDEEVSLLRDYVHQGGFLFAVQNCDSPDFDAGFRQLIQRLFPEGDYALRKLEPTHDVYRSEFVFPTSPPELWGVDFGCRTAIMYAPYDHACRWDKWMRNDSARTNNEIRGQIAKSMQLGINVVAYATGREVRDKLQRPDAIDGLPQALVRGQLQIGRLKHTGGWDTASNAVRHLQVALNKVDIETTPDSPVISATDPNIFSCPVLYMHGRKNFTLSPEEASRLKEYFQQGGFLMADACCGAKPFDQSFRKAIKQIFDQDLQKIPVEHEMFHSTQGFDVRKVRRRIPEAGQTTALRSQETEGEPLFEGIELNGRFVVVYSRYDISCALERQQTAACAGYLNEDAVKLAVNVILYSLYQ